jgi:A/G-specific adenine glycosylase
MPDAAVPFERTTPIPAVLPSTSGPAEPAGPLDLLDWFAARRRDLPWRRTRDPWAVLVSEVMLQQTQVDRVVPRWESFLARFPSVAACAAAPAGDVLDEWVGLGYNRRAVNLWRAAVVVTERHGGCLPRSLVELLALPGVGPYTARAVLAFAYEVDVGVVDTNVGRVLARRAGRPLRAREVQALADAAVPPGQGWAHNQAMLDLGATICSARAPSCEQCPARQGCTWSAAGLPDPDPAFGSAGVSGRQARYEGSDRQGRGRLVAALRAASVPLAHLADVMGWPHEPARAERVACAVVRDGLAVRDGETYRLP